jgi:hypothetical protein
MEEIEFNSCSIYASFRQISQVSYTYPIFSYGYSILFLMQCIAET